MGIGTGSSTNGDANSNNTVITIPINGNVGIGTEDPDAKLTVKGDIHTKEVRVDVSGSMVGDYVFEKDYNLLSLDKLEIYLKQNKHLPDVPSAKEFEEDGMKLKEMNLMLLKKVEELTLHLIVQDKTNEAQNKKIDVLTAEIVKLKTK